jgi:hypothetical protein
MCSLGRMYRRVSAIRQGMASKQYRNRRRLGVMGDLRKPIDSVIEGIVEAMHKDQDFDCVRVRFATSFTAAMKACLSI